MWIAKNKFDKNGEDSLVLWFDDEMPTRMENGDYKYWFGVSGIELKYVSMNLYKKYKYLTWEDDPVEVEIVPKKKELTKDDWQIIVYKIKEVEMCSLQEALDTYKSDRDGWVKWYNKGEWKKFV